MSPIGISPSSTPVTVFATTPQNPGGTPGGLGSTEPTVTRQSPQPTTGSKTRPRKFKYGDRSYTLEQMLRDPKKRSKLPIDLLSPTQRSAREQRLRVEREDADPLNNPMQQLAGHDLARAARRLAGLEIDPEVSAINREMGDVERQGAAQQDRAAAYYRELGDRQAATAQAQTQATQGLNERLAAITAGTQQQMTSASQEEAQRLAGDAAQRGAGLDGGSGEAVAREIAAQKAASLAAGQTFQATGATQSAAGDTLLRGTQAASQQSGGELQQELGNRLASALGDLRGKRTDVASKRGALETKYLTDLRQSSFENELTSRELGANIAAKAAEVEADAAAAKADSNKEREAFIAQFGVSPEKWRSMSPTERLSWKRKWEDDGKDAPEGKTTDHYGYSEEEWAGMSVQQRRNAKAQWENAGKDPDSPEKESERSNDLQSRIQDAADYFKRFRDNPKLRGYDRAQMIERARKMHADTYGSMKAGELNAAIDLAVHGRVRAPSRKYLRSVGIRVSNSGQLL